MGLAVRYSSHLFNMVQAQYERLNSLSNKPWPKEQHLKQMLNRTNKDKGHLDTCMKACIQCRQH